MDVIGSHAAQLPAIDDKWSPQAFERSELVRGLLRAGIAGDEVSHPLDNVLRNVRLLLEGDSDKQFGLSGVSAMDPEEVLELIGRAAGFVPDPEVRSGPVPVAPRLGLDRRAG